METQFAKWWVPDEVVFLDEIPKTSVGKFLKSLTTRSIDGTLISKCKSDPNGSLFDGIH